MNELVDDVRIVVKMFLLRMLEDMMERALQVEDKNQVIDDKLGLRPRICVTP